MPAETSVSDSFRQDLVDSGIVIRTEGLTRSMKWARSRCTR